jgi:preprotein translocase subunit SecF
MRLRLVKQDTKFDFFSRSKMWIGLSVVLMVVGFASFLYQGLNYGIDFKGGTTIRTESTRVRIAAQEGQEAVKSDIIAEVQTALQVIAADIKFVSVESVGPKVSGELIQTAAIAVILAIAAVLIYIWLRFEWQFALGAVAALVHDVILTIGIFSELQIKFDLAIIAALLTIVGYSLNDTVVVFDRVRENLRKYKKKDLKTFSTSLSTKH